MTGLFDRIGGLPYIVSPPREGNSVSERLAPWSEYVELLKPAGQLRDLLLDPASEQLRADLYRQLLMNVSLGYFLYFQSSPEHPDWAPFLNSVFLLQPNPDDTYLLAPVRGDGIYRISGTRGTVKLLTCGTGRNMMGMSAEPGRNFGYFDVDDLDLGPHGELEVILSAVRPADHRGNWWPLHPDVRIVPAAGGHNDRRPASTDRGDVGDSRSRCCKTARGRARPARARAQSCRR